MINKLVIFGSNGMLGNYLFQYFSKSSLELISITRKDFEITADNIHNLYDFLKQYLIDENTCIINCVGKIPQRHNNNYSEYFIINTIFPICLANICSKYNAKLICPTTDCVFSGDKGNYKEMDFHDDKTTYGISKSLGEPINATVIRTSIIGEEKYNKRSFLEFVKNSNGEINGWDNHYWNGITCYQYCKVIEKIINENIFWKGVRHLYSPESKSKYDLALIIAEVYKLPIKINKLSHDKKVDKTLKSDYDINTLFNISSIEEQIIEQSHFMI